MMWKKNMEVLLNSWIPCRHHRFQYKVVQWLGWFGVPPFGKTSICSHLKGWIHAPLRFLFSFLISSAILFYPSPLFVSSVAGSEPQRIAATAMPRSSGEWKEWNLDGKLLNRATKHMKLKNLFYFEWSPPWHFKAHIYIYIYINICIYILTVYLPFFLAFYLPFYCGILSGIYSGILFDIYSGILSDKSSVGEVGKQEKLRSQFTGQLKPDHDSTEFASGGIYASSAFEWDT